MGWLRYSSTWCSKSPATAWLNHRICIGHHPKPTLVLDRFSLAIQPTMDQCRLLLLSKYLSVWSLVHLVLDRFGQRATADHGPAYEWAGQKSTLIVKGPTIEQPTRAYTGARSLLSYNNNVVIRPQRAWTSVGSFHFQNICLSAQAYTFSGSLWSCDTADPGPV